MTQTNVKSSQLQAHIEAANELVSGDHENKDYWLLTVVLKSGHDLYTNSNMLGDLFCLLHTFDGRRRSRTVASSIVYNTVNPSWPSNGNGNAFVLPVVKEAGISLVVTIWDASESIEEAVPVGKVEIPLDEHLHSVQATLKREARDHGAEEDVVECLLAPQEFKVSLTPRPQFSHHMDPTLTLQLGRSNVRVGGEAGKNLALKALLRTLHLERRVASRERILGWSTVYESSTAIAQQDESGFAASSPHVAEQATAPARPPPETAGSASAKEQLEASAVLDRLTTMAAGNVTRKPGSGVQGGPLRAQAELLARLRPVSRRDGEVVLRSGTIPRSILFVRSGAVAVYMGGEQVSRIEAGQFVGEIGLLLAKVRVADVRASGPVELLELDAEDLWLALDLFPGLYGDLKRFAVANEARRSAMLNGSGKQDGSRAAQLPGQDESGKGDQPQSPTLSHCSRLEDHRALREFQMFLQNVASRVHAWLPMPPRGAPRQKSMAEAFGLHSRKPDAVAGKAESGNDAEEDSVDLAASFDCMSGVAYSPVLSKPTEPYSHRFFDSTVPAERKPSVAAHSQSPNKIRSLETSGLTPNVKYFRESDLSGVSMIAASFDSMSGIEYSPPHFSPSKCREMGATSCDDQGNDQAEERQDEVYTRYMTQLGLSEQRLSAKLASLVLNGVFDVEISSPGLVSPSAYQSNDDSSLRLTYAHVSEDKTCSPTAGEHPNQASTATKRQERQKAALRSLTAEEDTDLQPLRGHVKDAIDGVHGAFKEQQQVGWYPELMHRDASGDGDTDWSEGPTDSATSSPDPFLVDTPENHSLPATLQDPHHFEPPLPRTCSMPEMHRRGSSLSSCRKSPARDEGDGKVCSIRKRFRLRFRRAFDIFTPTELGATPRRDLSVEISDVTVRGLKHKNGSCFWILHDSKGKILARSKQCYSVKRKGKEVRTAAATADFSWEQSHSFDVDEDDLRVSQHVDHGTISANNQDFDGRILSNVASPACFRLVLYKSRMMLLGGDALVATAQDLQVAPAVQRPGIAVQQTCGLLQPASSSPKHPEKIASVGAQEDQSTVTVTMTVKKMWSKPFEVYVPAITSGAGQYAIVDHCGVTIAILENLGRTRSSWCCVQEDEMDHSKTFHRDSCGATQSDCCSQCFVRGWSECVVLWDASMRRRLGSVCVDVTPMKHARARLWDQNDSHFATIRALGMPNPDVCAGVGFKIVPTFSELLVRSGNVLPSSPGVRPNFYYYVYQRPAAPHRDHSRPDLDLSSTAGDLGQATEQQEALPGLSREYADGGPKEAGGVVHELVAEIVRSSKDEASRVLIQPGKDATRTLLFAVGIAEACRLRPRALPARVASLGDALAQPPPSALAAAGEMAMAFAENDAEATP